MGKNDIIFSYNFYRNNKNYFQLKTNLIVYSILIVGSVLFGCFIFDFKFDFKFGLDRKTLDYWAVFFVALFFMIFNPIVGFFKLRMNSRLIRRIDVCSGALKITTPFGRVVIVKKYQVVKGFFDYLDGYDFLWLKGRKYIKEPLIKNEGIHFTIRDLDSGKLFLFTADKDLLNDPDWLNLDGEDLKESRILS